MSWRRAGAASTAQCFLPGHTLGKQKPKHYSSQRRMASPLRVTGSWLRASGGAGSAGKGTNVLSVCPAALRGQRDDVEERAELSWTDSWSRSFWVRGRASPAPSGSQETGKPTHATSAFCQRLEFCVPSRGAILLRDPSSETRPLLRLCAHLRMQLRISRNAE